MRMCKSSQRWPAYCRTEDREAQRVRSCTAGDRTLQDTEAPKPSKVARRLQIDGFAARVSHPGVYLTAATHTRHASVHAGAPDTRSELRRQQRLLHDSCS